MTESQGLVTLAQADALKILHEATKEVLEEKRTYSGWGRMFSPRYRKLSDAFDVLCDAFVYVLRLRT